jgi:hypothetical protein
MFVVITVFDIVANIMQTLTKFSLRSCCLGECNDSFKIEHSVSLEVYRFQSDTTES